LRKTEVELYPKQTFPFFLSFHTADSSLYSSYKHVSFTISSHVHVKESITVPINTPFCFFSFICDSASFFFFTPSAYSFFFSKGKQLISMSFYMHCLSRQAGNFLLFCFIRGRKRAEKKEKRIKCEHAHTVWKKE